MVWSWQLLSWQLILVARWPCLEWLVHGNDMAWHHPHDTYHDYKLMQWMVATTIALVHHTHCIWVMPKVLFDHGIHFIWTMLDMQSIEEMVEVRETNFPMNTKSWGSLPVPFAPIAHTALGHDGRIFAQLDATSSASNDVLAWNASTYE